MYYRQPRYFNEFHCLGSDCPDNCCYGWDILWEKEEVEKVLGAPNISPELMDIIKKAFIPNAKYKGKLQIQFDDSARCPCVTENGLCRIQKELGAEYLSHTCQIYPRNIIHHENVLYRYCSTTCRVVMGKLLNNSDTMSLINVPNVIGGEIKVSVTTNKDKLEQNPELQYRGELLEFFYDLISDKKIPVESAIILGALAAQKLTQIVANKRYDLIPEALKSFRKQFHNAAQLKAIEDIKPNYYLKFGFLSELIEKVIKEGATALLHDETGTLNIDLYDRGEAGLREALKGREFFLRNLALNLLFEFAVPFKFEEKTIFENYSLFAAAFGLLKLNLIAVCSTEKGITMRTYGQEFVYNGDDKLIGMTAIICRCICQSKGKARAVLGLMKDNKFTTPAYLALLVK